MPATIIDGKAIAAEVQEELRAEAARLREAGIAPCLAVVLVGDDPASHVYVRGKKRAAERLGIEARDHLLPASTPEADLRALVAELNADAAVHGILIQTPLPAGLDQRGQLASVAPEKD